MIRPVTQKPWPDPNRELCDPLHPYIAHLKKQQGWPKVQTKKKQWQKYDNNNSNIALSSNVGVK